MPPDLSQLPEISAEDALALVAQQHQSELDNLPLISEEAAHEAINASEEDHQKRTLQGEIRNPTLRDKVAGFNIPLPWRTDEGQPVEIPFGGLAEPLIKGASTATLATAGGGVGLATGGLPGAAIGLAGGGIAGNVLAQKAIEAVDDLASGKIPSFGMDPDKLRSEAASGAIQGLLLPVFNLVFDKGVRYVGDKVGGYGKDFGKRKFQNLEADLIKAKKIDPDDLKILKAFKPSLKELDDVDKTSMLTYLKEARQDHGVFDDAANFAGLKKNIDAEIGRKVRVVNPTTGIAKTATEGGKLAQALDDQFKAIAGMETTTIPFTDIEQALLARKSALIDGLKANETGLSDGISAKFQKQIDNLWNRFGQTGMTVTDLKNARQGFQNLTGGAFQKAADAKPITKSVHESLAGVFKELQDGRIQQLTQATPEMAEKYFADSQKYHVLKTIQPVVNKAVGTSAKNIEANELFNQSSLGNLAVGNFGTAAKIAAAKVGAIRGKASQNADDMFAQSQIARRLLGKPVTGPLDIRDSGLLLDKLTTNLDPRQWGPRAIGGAINFVRSSIDNRIVRPVVIERSADKVVDNWDGIKDSFSNLMLKQAFSQSQETGGPMQDAAIMRQQLQQVEEMTDGILAPLKKAVDLGQYDTTAYELSSLAKQFPEAFPQPKTGVLGEVTTGKQVYFPDIADRQIYAKKLVEAPDLSPITKGKILSGLKKNGYVREVPKL